MYKVMTYAAVVFQVLSSDRDETESGGGATLVRGQSSFVKYSAVLLKIRPAARIFRGITSQWAIS